RRAGTVTVGSIRDDPGSAMHRFASLALHRVRDATHRTFVMAGLVPAIPREKALRLLLGLPGKGRSRPSSTGYARPWRWFNMIGAVSKSRRTPFRRRPEDARRSGRPCRR